MSQLTNYVQKELGKGFAKKRIAEKLLQAGYTQKEIEESFASINSAEPLLRRALPEIHGAELQVRMSKWIFPIIAGAVLVFFAVLLIFYMKHEGVVEERVVEKIVSLEDCSISPTNSEDCQTQVKQSQCQQQEDYFGCLTNLALQENEPQLCNKSEQCIITLAIAQKDGSLCKTYLKSPSACARDYYKATGDASYCVLGDLECGYDASTSYAEKQAFFEKQSSVLEEDDSEYVIGFAIEYNEPLVCVAFVPEDSQLKDIIEKYSITASDFCILAITYHNQDASICSLFTETYKNSTCHAVLNCDSETQYEDLCHEIQ